MNIPNLIKEMSEQFERPVVVNILITSKGKSLYQNFPLLSPNSTTRIANLQVNLSSKNTVITLHLYHHNCTENGNKHRVKKGPIFCKYCGNTVLTKEDTEKLGLPVGIKTKPKLSIAVGPLGGYYTQNPKFEVNNLLLINKTWWHSCEGLEPQCVGKYYTTHMTINKFPHKCKKCNKMLGAKDFKFSTAFKILSFI